jgi:hypothetical protein
MDIMPADIPKAQPPLSKRIASSRKTPPDSKRPGGIKKSTSMRAAPTPAFASAPMSSEPTRVECKVTSAAVAGGFVFGMIEDQHQILVPLGTLWQRDPRFTALLIKDHYPALLSILPEPSPQEEEGRGSFFEQFMAECCEVVDHNHPHIVKRATLLDAYNEWLDGRTREKISIHRLASLLNHYKLAKLRRGNSTYTNLVLLPKQE